MMMIASVYPFDPSLAIRFGDFSYYIDNLAITLLPLVPWFPEL